MVGRLSVGRRSPSPLFFAAREIEREERQIDRSIDRSSNKAYNHYELRLIELRCSKKSGRHELEKLELKCRHNNDYTKIGQGRSSIHCNQKETRQS
jgi:hypothetical protein